MLRRLFRRPKPTCDEPEPESTGWYRIFGISEEIDLWIDLESEGPEELEDGRWLEREVAWGRGDRYPARWWFRQSESSAGRRHGDVVWTAVSAYCVVSERFVDALGRLGITGWSTYPITILDRADVPMDGYVGFIAPLELGQEMVTDDWQDGTPGYGFLVTERVLDGLLAAGINLFGGEPAEPHLSPPPLE